MFYDTIFTNLFDNLHVIDKDIMGEIASYLDPKSKASLSMTCKLSNELCKNSIIKHINDYYSNMYKFMNFSNNFTGYDIYRKIPYVKHRTRTLNTPFARGYYQLMDLAFIGIRLKIITNQQYKQYRTTIIIWMMGNKSKLDKESSIILKEYRFKRWIQFALCGIIESKLHELIENPNKIIYHKFNNVSYQIKLDDTYNRKSILQIPSDGDEVEIFLKDIDQICGKKEFVCWMATILLLTTIVIYHGCTT